MIRQHKLNPDTLAGAIKLRAWEQNKTLIELAPWVGMKPDSLRQRLSITRGKRALQPWQVSALAAALDMDATQLHRLAARHEGWKI